MKQSDNEQKRNQTFTYPNLVLLRFSEIAIKSPKTRKRFIKQLVDHIEHILTLNKITNFEIIKEFSRIFVLSNSPETVSSLIANTVPGVVSTSIVYKCKTKLDEMKDIIDMKYLEIIQNHSTFAVRVKRTGKHSFSSMELGAIIGEFILEKSKDNPLKVDLTNPEYSLNLEVRDENTYIFDSITPGLGGLPAGCQGTVLVLVSGTEEDKSNIIKLYKRGANTIVYSVKPMEEINQEFLKSIEVLTSLQPMLNSFRKKIFLPADKLDIKHILEFYKRNQCSGIGMSKELLEELSELIPNSIPVFVPHLVTEIEHDVINRIISSNE